MSVEDLTPREVQVAKMVAAGRSYRGIGEALQISERTARVHAFNAAEKIGGPGSPKVRLIVFVVNLLNDERRQD